jgi:carotenoid cleavage dioxygenase-like enzyme
MTQQTTAKKERITSILASPYLADIFTPLTEERTKIDLRIEGELPEDLSGDLIFNSSNPAFKPKAYYSWFDGDGMVHATRLRNKTASYVNKFVKTEALNAEKKSGGPMWDGLLGKIDPTKDHFGLKDSSNTSVIWHDNKLLSLWHLAGKAYEINRENLETVGAFQFQGRFSGNMAAHTKQDPKTKDLVFFSYDLHKPPYYHYGVMRPGGDFHFTPIDIERPSYFHDIAITQHYSVIIDLPLLWNINIEQRRRRGLFFDKDRPARFGVIPRTGGNADVRWFEAKPCYMYHIVNAYEENNKIILYGCRIDNPVPEKPDPRAPREGVIVFASQYHRWEFDLATGETKEEQLDDIFAEFPRINENFTGSKHLYSYHGRFSPERILQDALVKYDREANTRQIFEMPRGFYCNEAIYVDSTQNENEDGGYLLSYVSHAAVPGQVWVFRAEDITAGPIAKIHLPDRLPPVFHGCWVAA